MRKTSSFLRELPRTIFSLIIMGGFFIAVLLIFNYDIFAFIKWVISNIWEAMKSVANFLLSMPVFRTVFKG